MRIAKPWKLQHPDEPDEYVREEYGRSYGNYAVSIAHVEYIPATAEWYWSFVYERHYGYSSDLETAQNHVDRILLENGWKLLNDKHIPFT